MGIFADNLEKYNERFDRENYPGILAIVYGESTSKDYKPKRICPYCSQAFEEEKCLHAHIISTHSNKYFYLKINDQIIREKTLIDVEIRSFELINNHDLGIRYELYFDGREILTGVTDKEISLAEYIRGKFPSEIKLLVDTNPKKEFLIYYKKLPPFDGRIIDELSFKFLFRPLNDGVEPETSKFRKEVVETARNRLEETYANGLLDYALGFKMEKENKEPKEFFENAFYLLKNFNTVFAMTAFGQLAFRLNLFEALHIFPHESLFSNIHLFFCNRHKIPEENIVYRPKEMGVYFDDFTETYFRAINFYYSEEFEKVLDCCQKLQMSLGASNNKYSKLKLLYGRTKMKMGKKEEAMNAYKMLYKNPFFCKEAEEILNENA